MLLIGKYLAKRILSKILMLVIITFIAFVLMNISRVDPAESYVRRHATVPDKEVIENLREEMGLNKPVVVQYFDWISNIVRLDFGTSLVTGNKVIDDMYFYIKPTLLIVLVCLIITVFFTILFGILSAVYENTLLDKIIRCINIMGVSVPNFWIGFVLLYIFALKLRWIPSLNKVSLIGSILPAITMALLPICHYSRLLRVNIVEEFEKEYILNCYARGVSKFHIVMIHALKNAIQPLIPLFFQNIGYLIIGSAVIESVFTWPGLGLYTLHGIFNRDFPVVIAFIILSAIIFSINGIISEFIELNINKKLMEKNDYE